MRFFDLFDLESEIQILDVGASAINEVPIYKRLMDIGIGRLSAFEGDERQIAAIREAYGPKADVFREFLFDGSVRDIHLASPESGMSSLLKPDIRALKFFNGFESFGHIFSVEQVSTTRLDDVPGLPAIDLMKMDIQGGELTVLKNGTERLKDCLAVQLEVSFVCLYENQPSFGEVDLWMRSQGFIPQLFLEIKRWSIRPTIFGGNFRIAGNQLLEGDIVYVKSPLDLERFTDEQLKKLIVISHYCLKSYDLSGFLLLELERRGVTQAHDYNTYLANLSVYA